VGVLWSALVVCLAARQAVRGPAARRALQWLMLALAVALCVVQVWLVAARRAPAWTLLPYALLLGFWLWLALAVRRARRRHPPAP
jgi:hypothetical protein